jgi:hypothetical protein
MMSQRDPATLAPAERFQEVAAILAAGVRRLRDRAALRIDHPAPENPAESLETCLEVSPETVLSVQRG